MAVVVLTDPVVSIDGTDYSQMLRSIRLSPTENRADAESWGAPGLTIPATPTWNVAFSWVQNFAASEFWNDVRLLSGTNVVWIIAAASGAAAATNPTATFNGYVPYLPFLDATVSAPTSILSAETTTVGPPVFAIA